MTSLSEREQMAIELIGAVASQLQEGQVIHQVGFTGRSMLPLLRQGKDRVDLMKAPERLKRYDLPLYLGPRGKYVMHRIIAIDDDCYICRGDNTYCLERIRREQIVAVVSAIHRGNRRIPVTAWYYQAYCRIWNAVFPLRKAARACKHWLRRRLQ